MSGLLLVAGTPIGNLADASPRLTESLAMADLVVCEDTRAARRLGAALGVRLREVRPMRGERAISPSRLAHRLDEGACCVLTTDAGMPGTSDPGGPYVAAARAIGAEVRVVPGPSAATAALALWPHEVPSYRVAGFLPRSGQARHRSLAVLIASIEPTVVFEAPGRVRTTVAELALLEPTRELLLARELTKLHEESVVLPAAEALIWLEARDARGEWVIVVGPATTRGEAAPIELQALADALAASSMPLSEAARILARLGGLTRREAYDAVRSARPGAGRAPR